jgi:hypothetical protein
LLGGIVVDCYVGEVLGITVAFFLGLVGYMYLEISRLRKRSTLEPSGEEPLDALLIVNVDKN